MVLIWPEWELESDAIAIPIGMTFGRFMRIIDHLKDLGNHWTYLCPIFVQQLITRPNNGLFLKLTVTLGIRSSCQSSRGSFTKRYQDYARCQSYRLPVCPRVDVLKERRKSPFMKIGSSVQVGIPSYWCDKPMSKRTFLLYRPLPSYMPKLNTNNPE